MPDTYTAATSPDRVCPLLNGVKIREVTVKTVEGAAFDLTAAVKTKPAVLVFYRGGW